MKFNKLTLKEERVIVYRETEPPFSGEYDNFYENGIYVCRRCNTPLYKSENKFNAHCGWPSFDDEINNSVDRSLDSDGIRTEITCTNCGAHLGHVFLGEDLTLKNIRHCVNSLSLQFVPQQELDTAILGGGCFWCLEAIFVRMRGIVSVISGYSGGKKEFPTYEDVSGGETGHAEVIKIVYYPKVIKYKDLLEIFFYLHDPTTLNRQGSDIGSQYRSIILYSNEKQKEETFKVIKELKDLRVYEKEIVTEVKPFVKFYQAEDYHQNYFKKNPGNSYCQAVIYPKIKKIEKKFKKFFKK